MPDDPYSSLGEGFKSGLGGVVSLAGAKIKQQENQREQQKMQFDEMRKNLQTYSEVLKSDAPQPIRQAAANGILGMYRKHGKDMGIDPSQIPGDVAFSEDFAKEFSNKVLSMNKLYEKGIIGKNDYRVGMFDLAGKYKDSTGKENPDVMKMANEVATPDAKMFDAVVGDKKIRFQETAPGSGQFAPMKSSTGVAIEGPAVQRVEMVKPPSEAERTNIAQTRADISMYDQLSDVVKKNPAWVGIGKDSWSKVAGTLNMMPQDQQEFYSSMRLNKLKDTKFFLGTAQSKQEAKNAVAAIPDISMGPKQLLGAIQATKQNKQRMLDRTMEVLKQSGLQVPADASPDDVVTMYNHAKAAGRIQPGAKPRAAGGTAPGGRPSLNAIFFDQGGEGQ